MNIAKAHLSHPSLPTEGTTIVAQTQKAGRGRWGRTWLSAPDAGLWMTTILYPQIAPSQTPQLSLVSAVALHKALSKLGAQHVGLKWPNDLLVQDRKIAGILLERHEQPEHTGLLGTRSAVLVGMGLNLRKHSQMNLPEELTSIYVGLQDIIDDPVNPNRCLEVVLTCLHAEYTRWTSEGFKAARAYWNQADTLTGQRVAWQSAQGEQAGTATGIDTHGRLVVRTTSGDQPIDAGEIRLLGKK